MVGVHFVDRDGTDWMVLGGLPTDFPVSGVADVPIAGLTFRSDTGDLRVLPFADIPRPASVDISVPPLGTGARLRGPQAVDWERLLRHAVVWPQA